VAPTAFFEAATQSVSCTETGSNKTYLDDLAKLMLNSVSHTEFDALRCLYSCDLELDEELCALEFA